MSDYNTESNNSNSKEPRRFGDDLPDDPDRQEELVSDSMREYRQMQRWLEQEADEYLYRGERLDHFGVGYGDE